MSMRRYAVASGTLSPTATDRAPTPPSAPSGGRQRSLALIVAIAVPALLLAFKPAAASTESYLLMPRAELLSLPASGAAWDAMKAVADGAWGSPDLCDQNVKHGTQALAGALVYARTGAAGYYTKVRNAIFSAMGTEHSDCRMLSIGRQLGSYVFAADFINLSGTDDATFRAWLSKMRTEVFTGHTRWQTLRGTHEDSANNWGAFAGASRIAVSLYLGDSTDVALAANVLRGFLGDRTAWDHFRGDGSTNSALPATLKVWACDPSPTGFLPTNAPCSKSGINVDGGIVSDVSRDDQGLTWPVGAAGMGYTNESLQGLMVQAELLYRNGYGNPWTWSNSALARVARLVSRNGAAGGLSWNISSVNYHVPWMLNFRYGLKLPTKPARYGRIFGYTDWLYGGRSGATATTATVTATATATPRTTTATTSAPTTTTTTTAPTAGSTAAASQTAAATASPSATATAAPTATAGTTSIGFVATGAIPSGPIHSPIAGLSRMMDPEGTGFTGVRDPLGSGNTIVRNVNAAGLADGHTTMGTYRDLPEGSTSYSGFRWLYMSPTDLVQTGRNLIYQVQMVGSPAVAISTENGRYVFVTRDGAVMKRQDLGPIPWGHWVYFIVGLHIADAGMADVWMKVDAVPDVSQPATLSRSGQQTYQGAVGHNTIGQYSGTHSGSYVGYWDRFVRAATATRAAELLR